MNIVKIPHASVEDAACDDGLQLFGKNSLDIVRHDADCSVLEHQLEAVFDFSRRDKISGGDVDFEGLARLVEDGFDGHAVAGIVRFPAYFLYPRDGELHAVVNRGAQDFLNGGCYFGSVQGSSLDGGVHVHCGSGADADH